MTTKEITLKLDIKDIKSIYFEGNKQKYFFGPETKRQSLFLVMFILIYPVFAYYALKSTDSSYFIWGSILLSFLVYHFLDVAKPIYKWKKSILKFLKKLEKIEVVKFKYNNDFFIHQEDKNELKQYWNIIDRAIINERYIWIFSNTNILLPKSSMSDKEYFELSEVVLKNVKNVEKNNSVT